MNLILNISCIYNHENAIHTAPLKNTLAVALPIYPFSWHMSLTFDQTCNVHDTCKSRTYVSSTLVLCFFTDYTLHLPLIHNGAAG